MVRSGLIGYFQFKENCQQEGFLATLKKSLYQCDETVPVEKDLANLKNLSERFSSQNLEILELNQDNYFDARYKHSHKSRQERALHYLRSGYRTFVVVKEDEIVAEVWYVTKSFSRLSYIHPRVKWFGIEISDVDVYLFDLFVNPEIRKSFPTTVFLAQVLSTLQKKGFEKAYGDYVSNNTPALWVHRSLGYKEHPSFAVKRYLLVEYVKKSSSEMHH